MVKAKIGKTCAMCGCKLKDKSPVEINGRWFCDLDCGNWFSKEYNQSEEVAKDENN